MMRPDPVLLEIVSAALVSVAEEMSVTVWRTSRSTTVRELLDYSTAVFDGQGRNVAQAARMPVHLNSMELCLHHIAAYHIPLDEWRDGEVIVTNDPYCGGQHLPDFIAFKPVFRDGQRIAITCVLIHHVDVGGGLGIPYRQDNSPPPDPVEYAKLVRRHTDPLGCKVILEPGRLIAGNAGVMVTRVEYVKKTDKKSFVIVDAAMNDLIRPTLYEAHHDILPMQEAGAATIRADIVGPVCETGDYLGLDREMADVAEGDLLVVMSAGAYGAVMSSTYNTRPLIAEVLVDGGKWHTVRPRQTLDELIGLDSVPEWVKDEAGAT